MLSADGTSTALGLTFREHDNRQMQYILRAHSRLPDGPAARPVLYLALTNLETSLPPEEAQKIREWLRDGGVRSDFPGPSAAQDPPIDGSTLWAPTPMATPLTFLPHNLPVAPPGQLSRAASDVSFETDHDDHLDNDVASQVSDETDPKEVDGKYDKEDIDMDSESKEDLEGTYDIANQAAPMSAPMGSKHKQKFVSNSHVPEGWKHCSICINDYAPDDFPESGNITSTCDHYYEQLVCINCIRRTIGIALSRGEFNRIP
ncbi:hypothetical protein ONS96_013196 [Cadophora gregata f. sp. sojae]|nr:hypothetical protein ONS96_013196 [Cadophora gregata f. sp. sojae]